MNIALTQLNYLIGDVEQNGLKIREAIGHAREKGADLVVFSELSVCGYPPADLLNFSAFTRECLDITRQIALECKGIAAIVGGPAFNDNSRGKKLYNAAFFLEDGEIKQVVRKALLPTYDVFDEYRYFEPANTFGVVNYMGRRIALTICEDIWNIDPNMLYRISPMDELLKQQPDLMINISASPFAWNRGPERLLVMAGNAKKYKLPLIYVNQVGAHTDLIFDGGSAVFNAAGELIDQMPPFTEGTMLIDSSRIQSATGHHVNPDVGHNEKYRLIQDALSYGITDYFAKTGLKRAIIGLSGGIDSALTLVLATMALGPENVWAVLLPGPHSSGHSVEDAEALALTLGVRYDIISITPVVDELEQSLRPFFNGLPTGIAEENLQARARAVILMGLSNKHGHVLLNTSNKSEAAVGYGTLYGDMCGGLSVIGDLYKTEVYELARYINRQRQVIPENSILKPPSAELRPGQKDSDSLPEYELLDAVLFKYIEEQLSPGEIIAKGFHASLVNRVVNLVNTSEYKRKQSPPVLRVSQKSFGTGRRMPLVGRYFS